MSAYDPRIVEVYELERYMNASFDSAASVEAGEQLDAAQSELEAFLGRPITVRTFENVLIDVPCGGSLWWRGDIRFEDAPVVTLLALTADDVAVDLTGSQTRSWGILGYAGAVGVDGTLRASYTAGLDGKNDPRYARLRTLVKRRASREMIPRGDGTLGTSSVSDEGYSETATAPSGGFTTEELQSVRRFKRRRMGRPGTP